MGSGSRTVVRDGGLAGAIVQLGHGFCSIREDAEGAWFGAALPLAVLARLGGPLAVLARAPGSIGASVSCDAGWGPWVHKVRYVGRGAERAKDMAGFEKASSRAVITEVCIRREVEAQPPAVEEPGGWYKPLDVGETTEAIVDASLSDTRLRDVAVPRETANALVNLGGGSARDLEILQRSVIDRVFRSRGVQLSDRMRWLGRKS